MSRSRYLEMQRSGTQPYGVLPAPLRSSLPRFPVFFARCCVACDAVESRTAGREGVAADPLRFPRSNGRRASRAAHPVAACRLIAVHASDGERCRMARSTSESERSCVISHPPPPATAAAQEAPIASRRSAFDLRKLGGRCALKEDAGRLAIEPMACPDAGRGEGPAAGRGG